MKYLLPEVYEKAVFPDFEEDLRRWLESCENYCDDLLRNKNRFPKVFLREYEKKYFHDNVFESLKIHRKELKTRYAYDIEMCLLEYADNNIRHQLLFKNVEHVKMDLNLISAGNADWIYGEFLPVDEKRLSLEVFLFGDSSLYFDFSRLHYKKEKLK